MRLVARTLVLALLAALAVAGPAAAAGNDAVDLAVIKAINVERTQRGLHTLRPNAALAGSADRWSAVMARRRSLSHGDVEGRLRKVAPSTPFGETLALVVGSESGLAKRVVRMWMHSSAHRTILLQPRLRRVGVGRTKGGVGYYVAADFSG